MLRCFFASKPSSSSVFTPLPTAAAAAAAAAATAATAAAAAAAAAAASLASTAYCMLQDQLLVDL